MSKHTPGPWHACELDWRVIESPTEHVIADIRTPPQTYGRADSALIAAAPDLLEALKRIEWVVGAGPAFCADCGRYRSSGHYKSCGLALAITKAEGKDA